MKLFWNPTDKLLSFRDTFSFICRMENFEKLDFKGSGVNTAKKQSGLNEYANSLFDPSLTWKDVKWLRNNTKLPIVIKGVLTG